MSIRATRRNPSARTFYWLTITLAAGACQGAGDAFSPAAQGTVTSANADGIWTATASASAGQGALTGWATFTGPEGKTRRMGMCLVQRDRAHPDGVACATAMDCDSVPARLPAGGSRYCVSAYGAEAKYCHYRPGPQSAYCVGSPALAGAEIAPGAYRKDIAAQPGSQWLALACFEGCAETPPSISASVTVK